MAYGRTYNDALFRDTFEHEYTWLRGFMRNVRRFSGRTAVIDAETGATLTYSQLNERVNRLSHALSASGVAKNDIVLCALSNCPDLAALYIAPRKLGAILLLANYKLSGAEMACLIERNKPKVVLYSPEVTEMIVSALERSAFVPERVIMADTEYQVPPVPLPNGHCDIREYVKGFPLTEPDVSFREHIYDEVLRLCTSGTTALPKCVPVNNINEVLSAHDVIMHYPLTHNDVCLNMTPWFHRGGCHSGGLCPSFYVGAQVVAMRAFKPRKTLELVEQLGITFLMGSPSNVELLARAQEKSAWNVEALRGIVTMGAPLSRENCIRYQHILTPRIFNGYGTTETFWNSFLRPYSLPQGAGSVGESCVDDEVRVVRLQTEGHAAPDDMVPHDNATVGEIIIKSPAKSAYTYIEDEEQCRAKFYNGWMYTGDTGVWDTDWIVTVRGRKDDMMVVSGENIYPEQIESVLLECSLVSDCAVTSVADPLRGQAVCAYIVPQHGATLAAIADFMQKSPFLSANKRPRYYMFVDEIFKTATGKKRRSLFKERAPQDIQNGLLRKY